MRKQRCALVRIKEGKRIELHADQTVNLNNRLVRIAVAKRRIWRYMVSDPASMKSPKRPLDSQSRARRKTGIGTLDDGRGGNRKTPISDLAGKPLQTTQRAEFKTCALTGFSLRNGAKQRTAMGVLQAPKRS